MKFLSYPDLRALKGIGYTRQHIDRLEKDGRFPKRVKFPGGPGARIGWIEEEIDAYQAAVAAMRDVPPPSPKPIPERTKIMSIASGKRRVRATKRAHDDEPPEGKRETMAGDAA